MGDKFIKKDKRDNFLSKVKEDNQYNYRFIIEFT